MLEEINSCPLCGSKSSSHFLTCKDHSVSQEIFHLSNCNNCHFVFTNPRPNATTIAPYYKSENYISHKNKSNSLINYLYKIVRNITLTQKLKLINSISHKGKVLDYGCGTGYFLKTCQKDGWEIQGVEPDQGANKLASELLMQKIHDNISELPDKKYQVITLWHVMEHIHDINAIWSMLYQKLSSDGKLIIAVPNYKSYDATHYKTYWAAYDVPRHLHHFEKETLIKFAEKYKFNVEQILPMKFDSFYVSMLSEQYKGNRYNLIKPFLTACLSNIYANKTNNYSSLIYILSK